MRKDHRPYIVKKIYQGIQKRYAYRFLRPQLEGLGKGCTFMKPWFVEIFGGPITVGDYCTFISTADARIRLTVWSAMGNQGAIDIGSYGLVCPGVRISAATRISIGKSCMLAQGVFITDADWHGLYDRSLPVGNTSEVLIGENVWIGDSAIVCKGVTIGNNSIIGAGSVVSHDIPENVIAAGNPAVAVKSLDPAQPMKTRADWLADPGALARQFDEIDRKVMKDNTWFGWLRSVFSPHRGD